MSSRTAGFHLLAMRGYEPAAVNSWRFSMPMTGGAKTAWKKMSEALQRSGAGIAYCGWQNVGLPGGRGEPFVPPDYEALPDKLERLFRSPCWPVHAALVRREIVDSVGGFDPKWRSCEDFAFWLRTATRNRLVRVPDVLAFYRFHGDQMVGKRDVVAISHLMVQMEFLARHPEVEQELGERRVRELTLGNSS